MKRTDFQIGTEFYTGAGKWRCTDVGTRIIAAIRTDDQEPRNLTGPPYSVAEYVFDEYDVRGCSLDPTEFEHQELPNQRLQPTTPEAGLHRRRGG